MGDFNVGFTKANMAAFCNEYKLKTLNQERTCFKNYMSPSCIDLFIRNCRKSFESTLAIEGGLSDFHKFIVSVLKVKHEKVPHKIIQYRGYKNFGSTRFFENLHLRLTHLDNNSLDFGSLKNCFTEILNNVALLKTKFLRANHFKFVTKDVSKAIMLRTKLRKKNNKEENFRGKN